MSTIVVTGMGSGIGAACGQILEERGHTPVGVDLRGAEFEADLSTPEGIADAVARVVEKYPQIDGVIANAGTQSNSPLDLKVNYFGARDTVRAFLPYLEKAENGRAVITASCASLQPSDPKLVQLLLDDQREEALAYGKELADQGPMQGYANYASSKRAIATWVRRAAVSEEFAGRGVGLNAVGPGVVATPMTKELLSTEEGRKQAFGVLPSPYHGASEARDIADALVFFVTGLSRTITGQILYIDGGADAILRGEDIWHAPKSMDAPAR